MHLDHFLATSACAMQMPRALKRVLERGKKKTLALSAVWSHPAPGLFTAPLCLERKSLDKPNRDLELNLGWYTRPLVTGKTHRVAEKGRGHSRSTRECTTAAEQTAGPFWLKARALSRVEKIIITPLGQRPKYRSNDAGQHCYTNLQARG